MKNPAPAEGRAPLKNAILIAGPTASGKSRLALMLAERSGGRIVNADSMQVYATLERITARPDRAALDRAPHHLYGHVDPARAYSTGAWLRDVAALVEQFGADNARFIFVGGTGLYFRALEGGLSDMPDIPHSVRRGWRDRLAREGSEALHRDLDARDPASAARLAPADGQRIVRALEVFEHTGRSIGDWQARRAPAIVNPGTARRLVLDVDRAALTRRIERRFDDMMASGALDEVRALVARGLDPNLPAMKAIGVPELSATLAGETTLEDAVSRAKTATRRYAKRQATWFRNQLDSSWTKIAPDTPVDGIFTPQA
ncbi:MAG: tRNA (adenosine(37)-N6)-dimethylallyltransferase MiaA [Nitratireductor sp.]